MSNFNKEEILREFENYFNTVTDEQLEKDLIESGATTYLEDLR